jgi:hypothetical protein
MIYSGRNYLSEAGAPAYMTNFYKVNLFYNVTAQWNAYWVTQPVGSRLAWDTPTDVPPTPDGYYDLTLPVEVNAGAVTGITFLSVANKNRWLKGIDVLDVNIPANHYIAVAVGANGNPGRQAVILGSTSTPGYRRVDQLIRTGETAAFRFYGAGVIQATIGMRFQA